LYADDKLLLAKVKLADITISSICLSDVHSNESLIYVWANMKKDVL